MNYPDRAPSSISETDTVRILLPKAVEILQRDLQLSNIDCDLSAFTMDVFRLRDAVTPLVERTGGPGSEAFYRLLYRVDIPESKIVALLQASSAEPIMARISELLIIRALQKAWTRAKFG